MQPVVLIVMDGFGLRDEAEGNAIATADTPNLDHYFETEPFTQLDASGEPVGLPVGFQGSSEVGHMNIGAGRLVKQEVKLIDEAIDDGSFFEDEVLLDAAKHVQEDDVDVHLMGLFSDEGVHSHTDHLWALMQFFRTKDIEPVVHAFTDGRDTAPRAAQQYFELLDDKIEDYGGRLGTVIGRYYAMDRDERWDRTELAYDALVHANGDHVDDWHQALYEAYEAGEDDEFIKPRIVDHEGIDEGDVIIFYNYRTDRPRQLTKALTEEAFDGFDRDYTPVEFIGMVEYYDDMPAPHLVEKHHPENGLGEYLSTLDKTQYRIAETEKYAHVTYFFNGEVEDPYEGEERIVVPSPKVATYDVKPAMSAYEITDKCVKVLDETDWVIMNYANCDMVGHTGDFDATVEAVEAVDDCIGDVVEATLERDGVVFITADHGNADTLVASDGDRVTSHTTTPVPFCAIGFDDYFSLKPGKLGDVAPTMLTLLDMDVPDEMTGDVLVT
jgi:2,3-bisphosphoglycerate-independent phosphoglycerate mutase